MADQPDRADHLTGLPMAGRWDRDPVRPNPGPGTWMDPGPVAEPEPADEPADDPVARLRRVNGQPPDERGNWRPAP